MKGGGIPEGAIGGVFSVSDTKKVYFSKGNLQYQSSPSLTLRFAENQYDYIGANNTASTGWRDLFSWGTGDDPTKMGSYDSYDTFNDWGSNAINNGGNTANSGWRTLTGGTGGEWEYLFNTRTVNGGTGKGYSYTSNQKVNNVLGVVLYPDNYTGELYTTAQSDNWSTFEAAGCVFLPAAGYRYQQYTYFSTADVGYGGHYWSSTPEDTEDDTIAYSIWFSGSSVATNHSDNRYIGESVRLVYDVTKTAHVIQDGDEDEDTVISTFQREYVERITGITTSSKTGYLNSSSSYSGFTSYRYKCPSGIYRPSWSVSFEKRIDSYDKYSSGKEVLTDSQNVQDSTYYYECDLDVYRYTDGTVKISQGTIRLADNQTNSQGENIISLALEGGNGSYTGSDTHLNTIIYSVDVRYNNSSIGTADVRIYSDDSFEITLYP